MAGRRSNNKYIKINKMEKNKLLKQANFARLVNQSPVRIYYLIQIKKLEVTSIDGVNFIEANEKNINIAKRRS